MKNRRITRNFFKKCKNASVTMLKRIEEAVIVLIMMKGI
jgi:hypothetical protein